MGNVGWARTAVVILGDDDDVAVVLRDLGAPGLRMLVFELGVLGYH
jgi:hypothetical protein